MTAPPSPAGGRWPLYVRILIGVACGVLCGLLLRRLALSYPGADVEGRTAMLGETGMLVIRLLKALATPLLLFAVIDAFLRTHIPAKKGAQLLVISAVNATVAIALGLLIANTLRGGERWQGQIPIAPLAPVTQVVQAVQVHGAPASASVSNSAAAPVAAPRTPAGVTLNPIKNLAAYVPESLVEPFAKNNVITVVLLALLLGVALRKLKDRPRNTGPGNQDNHDQEAEGIRIIESAVAAALKVFTQMLEWLITLIPLAVFCVITQVVQKSGLRIFGVLGMFLGTIVLGLLIHAVVYYSLLLRLVAGESPRRFFAGSLDAVLFALSAGSSLATLPVTLRCLTEKLGVSPGSARLAACVGTNLNHDGIILYEASAAVFVSQAFGFHLGLGQQVAVAAASVMAGIGIAGIPEAGLITLPLVLAAAHLPDAVAATALPLILPVDWIIGRCRAATNVLSDMTVARILDALDAPKHDRP